LDHSGQEVLVVSLKKDIRPVTHLKTKASDLLKQVSETQRPVVITQNGEPRAVLQDAKSYEDMRYALGLMKLISQGEEDVRKGKVRSQAEVFSKIANAIDKK
jgi:prevent-host-death family protein